MAQAKEGDTVAVHYIGKLSDGSVFDTSRDRDPIQFTIGDKKVIPGFEDGVIGMITGGTKTITIPCEKAYGFHRKELVTVVDRKSFPTDVELQIGQMFKLRQSDEQEDGKTIVVTVAGITETTVTLDANHPLAGKDLVFELELVEII